MNHSQAELKPVGAGGVTEPLLRRDANGGVDYDSIPDVIQWFLDYDQRVAVVKHPKVEEIFQWKQEQTRLQNEDVFAFNRAEDRLAVGIIQAIAYNGTEPKLHEWIAQLLNAIDSASKATEQITAAYQLDVDNAPSVVVESRKIPAASERADFLINCWLETLCTAEVRVLGWLYREMFGRAFHPENF